MPGTGNISDAPASSFQNPFIGDLIIDGSLNLLDDQPLVFGTGPGVNGQASIFWKSSTHELSLFDQYNDPTAQVTTDQQYLNFKVYGLTGDGRTVEFLLNSNYSLGNATALTFSTQVTAGLGGGGVDASILTGHAFQTAVGTIRMYGALSGANYSHVNFPAAGASIFKRLTGPIVIAAPGAGYAPGDQVAINDGDFSTVLNVDTVGGGGAITALSIVSAGAFFDNNPTAPLFTITGIGAGGSVVIDIWSGTLDYITTLYVAGSQFSAPGTAAYQLAAYLDGAVFLSTNLHVPNLPTSDPSVLGETYTFASSSGVGVTVLADLAAALSGGQKLVMVSNG